MSHYTINIYFGEDNDLSEWEAINKGWRKDVYVFINESIFNLNVYTPTRLLQDFEFIFRLLFSKNQSSK